MRCSYGIDWDVKNDPYSSSASLHPLLVLLLQADQLEIGTIPVLNQSGVAPLFHDSPVLQHRDDISVVNGGEPVRHHDGGAVPHDPLQRVLDHALRLHVQRAGGLIEQQDGRILYDGSGDGDPLLLASRQLDPSLPCLGRVALRESTDEGVGVRELCSLHNLCFCGTILAVDDVVVDGCGEEHGLLLNHADVLAELLQSQSPYIFACKPHSLTEIKTNKRKKKYLGRGDEQTVDHHFSSSRIIKS